MRHPAVPRFHQRDEGSPVRTQPALLKLHHYRMYLRANFPRTTVNGIEFFSGRPSAGGYAAG
jgi:hypothetical protein